jgi:hypothetical protein
MRPGFGGGSQVFKVTNDDTLGTRVASGAPVSWGFKLDLKRYWRDEAHGGSDLLQQVRETAK